MHGPWYEDETVAQFFLLPPLTLQRQTLISPVIDKQNWSDTSSRCISSVRSPAYIGVGESVDHFKTTETRGAAISDLEGGDFIMSLRQPIANCNMILM